VRQVLQRTHLVLGQRTLSADMEDGAFRTKRRRNAGYRVGAARSGCRDYAAQFARLPRVAIGGMRCNLLMAHVDDANAFIDTGRRRLSMIWPPQSVKIVSTPSFFSAFATR